MKIAEMLNAQSKEAVSRHTNRPYYEPMFLDYIADKERKEDAYKEPFVFFYTNVINTPLDFNYRAAIGDEYYDGAKEDAESCIGVCNDFQNMEN